MYAKSDAQMKFVDAHIHLLDKEYAEDIDEIIAEARNCNVVALVSNSMDYETSVGSLKLAEQYSGMVCAALGIHPWNVKASTEDEFQQTLDLILTETGEQSFSSYWRDRIGLQVHKDMGQTTNGFQGNA